MRAKTIIDIKPRLNTIYNEKEIKGVLSLCVSMANNEKLSFILAEYFENPYFVLKGFFGSSILLG